jgi:chromosomal replication initiator protein
MNSIADIWSNILDRMKGSLSETTIATWFDDTDPVALKDSSFILHSPNEFKRNTIEARYIPQIKDALRDIFSDDFDVVLLNDEDFAAFSAGKASRPTSLLESPEFTFERFVVGNSNKLAYAAARRVADAPAHDYNPLFIYGDSGLGKTHLIYAIAHEIRDNDPKARIVYIKGDDFTNELVQAIREGRQSEFHNKYRDADLLLMDDVQFISGRKETQEEFFHTFNTLYEAKRQIVLTSDRPPKEMTQLQERLQTRFEWGLLVDVQRPDYETRLAIIKNKASQLGVVLPDPICVYIAENVTANVRQIEGTVKKILAYRELLGSNIDEESAARAVRDMLKKDNEFVPSSKLIISEICKYYRIDESTIRGQQRNRDAVNGRQIAMYLIRRMTNLSLNEIGREFDDRDHATVMHSIEKVEKQMNENPAFAETVKAITANINSKN